MARYWSVTDRSSSRLAYLRDELRAKTDHAHCENAKKQHINVARMLEICVRVHQAVLHELCRGKSTFLSQYIELPAMHEQAGTSGLPISYYTAYIRPMSPGFLLRAWSMFKVTLMLV